MNKIGRALFFSTFILVGIFCFNVNTIQATNSGDVVINELMWMGSSVSRADEWIELRNLTSFRINFSETPWSIYKNDSLMLVIDKEVLEANDYFLISNNSEDHTFTGGESILNIAPDFIDSLVSLSNSSIQYKLYDAADNNGNLIDVADDGSKAPLAGDKDAKFSMERNEIFGDGTLEKNWHTCSQAVNLDEGISDCGTPRAQNSSGGSEPEPKPDEPEIDPQPDEDSDSYSLGDVVINEIAWMGTNASTADEWIELYNNSNQDINLNGWSLIAIDDTPNIELTGTIAANSYFLLERTDDATINDIVANLIYSGTLSNSGEELILYDQTKKLIDRVNCITDQNKKCEKWFAGVSGGKISMERINPQLDGRADNWSNNNGNIINGLGAKGGPINGTPKKKNSVYDANFNFSDDEQDDSPPPDGSGYVYQGGIPGSVVINEFVSDPEDGPEWIELYNKTNAAIDLTDWHLEEGSEAKTVLSDTISAHDYLLIENPKGHLNNSGDIIILFDDYSHIIDQVTYGKWDDGNLNDNAPKTSDPNGLGRIGGSQDTNNDSADWQVVSVLTQATANILVVEEEQEQISTLKNRIIITEIFPNPAGSDEKEFIELKNISEEEIDLANLIIGDNSKRRYKIRPEDYDSTVVPIGEFFIIPRGKSKIALNNTGGDKVVLYDNEENIIDEIEYKEKAPEGKSYALVESEWQWTDQPTAGAENIFTKENQPPVAVIDLDKSEILLGEEITLDSSDSYDPEGENLIIEWQARQENKKSRNQENKIWLYHDSIWKLAFDEIGNYEVKLIVSDGEMKTVEQVLINVLNKEESNQTLRVSNRHLVSKVLNFNLINEFIPNPEGSDEAEFIELFNPNQAIIDLSNFYLDDQEGGSRPYQISENTILEPLSFLIFNKEETKLALNNTTDAVRLLDQDKNILQQIDYDKVIEGASFARAFDGNWFWTEVVTGGEENQIAQISQEEIKSNLSNKKKKTDQVAVEIELNKIREMDLGDMVKTLGIVSVKPGVLGSQIFYITNSPMTEGVAGIQIYNYKKDFPELKIGDEIEVTGTLAQSREEYRLKTKTKDDIQILGRQDNLEPLKTTTSEIGEELEGNLVQLEGEIIEITGSNIFLDDGSDEVKIYLKKSTGIDKSNFQEGDIVTATGIVGQTTTGYRLLPRHQDDIQVIQVLGEELKTEDNASDIIIEPRNNDWLKYITATLGAAVLILLIVNLRMYRKRD